MNSKSQNQILSDVGFIYIIVIYKYLKLITYNKYLFLDFLS